MNDPAAAIADRAVGAYLGLAIGDALGATVEFMTPREIRHLHGVHQNITGGGWLRLARGDVTDDTTLCLALGDAIVAHPDWRLEAVAQSFAQWLRDGPVDCGNTCRRGIRRFLADGSLSGPLNPGDGGNGALMRNLPVALATLGRDADFARWSLEQCHITHHHELSDAATLAFGRMTQALILQEGADRVAGIAAQLVADFPVFRYSPYPGRASGYVVDTVQTSLHHFFAYEDFEACVVATVNRGEDADTTGAMAGMLAGARCGARALPARWVNAVLPRIRQRIWQQTEALLARTQAGVKDPR